MALLHYLYFFIITIICLVGFFYNEVIVENNIILLRLMSPFFKYIFLIPIFYFCYIIIKDVKNIKGKK